MPELPPFPPAPDDTSDASGDAELPSSDGQAEDTASLDAELSLEGDGPSSALGGLDDLRQQIITRLGEAQQSLLGLIEHFQAEQQHASEAAETKRVGLERELETLRSEHAARQSALETAERERDESRHALEAAETSRLEAEQALEAAQARMLESEQRLETELNRSREGALEPTAAVAGAAPAASGPSLFSLRHSLAALDAAPTQTEVLSRLLEESTGHAGRAALLLPREGAGGVNVWNATGFGDALDQGAEVEPPASLLGALDGRPVAGAEAHWQVDDLTPLDAVAVPLVLRDRVRAVLYADRTEGAQPFDVDALQILTYCAAEALETLPLRSIRPAGTLVDTTPPAEVEATVEAPVESTLEAPVEAPAEEEAEVEAGAEEIPEPEAPEVLSAETVDVEEIVVEEEELDAAPSFAVEAEEPSSDASADTLELDVDQAPSVAEEPPGVLEVASEEAAEEDADFEVLEADLEASEAEPAAEETPDWELHEESESVAEVTEPESEPVRLTAVPSPSREVEEAPAEPATEEPAAVVEEEESAEDFKTQAVRLDQIPAVPGPAETPARSAEVIPPSDVQGPGWAFTGSALSDSSAANEDPMHEEARRLARLLVSEIKLYNEEQIEEGKRQGNIYRFLKEPIDRSRVLYEERIDERVRSASDYYEEELVRSLANGDRGLLGL